MAVIEAKVAGQQVVEQPEVAEAASGNLVDLMKLLEASVKAQVAARDATAPLSLADAKAERGSKPAASAAAVEAEAVEADAEARPARRRRAS
jgi:hypothetical protein